MRVRVNSIESQWDNRVVPLETTWDVFRDFILQGHLQVASEDRSAVKLFNAAEYKSVDTLEGVPGALVYDDDPDKVHTRRLKEPAYIASKQSNFPFRPPRFARRSPEATIRRNCP